MRIGLDKLMTHAAYLYIILPFLIFCSGWLRWYYALSMAVILVISYFFSIWSTKDFRSVHVEKHTRTIIIAVLVIACVVFFSGIGEFSYQVEDHQFRNSVFHDLVTHSWPYTLNEHGNIPAFNGPILYTYYIEYWLPAALQGKIFGWQAANVFLYLWTVAGLILIFYFLCRLLGKASLLLLFIFFFFNGLYLLVSFFKFPVSSVITSDYQIWSGDMVLAGSGIDSLFWIFNQTVAPWLIILLILSNIPKQNMFFLYALCYFHGPFMFIGFFPFIAIMVLKSIFKEEGQSMMTNVKTYLTFQNLVGGLTIVLISYFYLSGSSAVQSLFLEHINLKKYVLFTFVSFGAISLLIFPKYRNEPFFYVILAMLLVLPLVGMGTIQPFTFCARVSLAPMFLLMIFVARYLVEEQKESLLRKLVVVYLILGSVEPALEFGRSAVFTIGYYIDPVAMNTYLYNRKTLYNDRISMLPQTDDLKSVNYLILNNKETLDIPGNRYTTYFKSQSGTTFFNKYLLKNK